MLMSIRTSFAFTRLPAEAARLLVMELLDGVPLSAYTRSCGRVPLAQRASSCSASRMVSAPAHAAGLFHRDFSPRTVFLAREPNGRFTGRILISENREGPGCFRRHGQRLAPLLLCHARVNDLRRSRTEGRRARAALWTLRDARRDAHGACPRSLRPPVRAPLRCSTPRRRRSMLGIRTPLASRRSFSSRCLRSRIRASSLFRYARALSAARGAEGTPRVAFR